MDFSPNCISNWDEGFVPRRKITAVLERVTALGENLPFCQALWINNSFELGEFNSVEYKELRSS